MPVAVDVACCVVVDTAGGTGELAAFSEDCEPCPGSAMSEMETSTGTRSGFASFAAAPPENSVVTPPPPTIDVVETPDLKTTRPPP